MFTRRIRTIAIATLTALTLGTGVGAAHAASELNDDAAHAVEGQATVDLEAPDPSNRINSDDYKNGFLFYQVWLSHSSLEKLGAAGLLNPKAYDFSGQWVGPGEFVVLVDGQQALVEPLRQIMVAAGWNPSQQKLDQMADAVAKAVLSFGDLRQSETNGVGVRVSLDYVFGVSYIAAQG